jgi:hypothetical protein
VAKGATPRAPAFNILKNYSNFRVGAAPLRAAAARPERIRRACIMPASGRRLDKLISGSISKTLKGTHSG